MISEEAIDFVKKHKREIIDKFCPLSDFPSSKNPFTMFMAGCPGAGKTEFSKSIIPELQKRDPDSRIVRIDADEIRSIIPQFTGSNSEDVQAAAAIGVEKIFDHVNHYSQNCILDGTFAKYDIARKNVLRSLSKSRKVGIFFIFQEPLIAWDFTKKRDAIEKRNIPRSAFIESFIASKENVIKIKDEFGDRVELNVIVKNEANEAGKTSFNVPTIDKSLGSGYTIGSLRNLLENY